MAKWYITHIIKLEVEDDTQEQAETKSFSALVEQMHVPAGKSGELIDWSLNTVLKNND